MDVSDKKVVVVCGPTASGKTDLALNLSHRFSGEMICADSMQIYKDLMVGTATLQPHEAKGIPQHLTGFIPPNEKFSVADYVCFAENSILSVFSRNNLPILCGGTGLYIKSLVEGITFTEQKASAELREILENKWQRVGPDALLQELLKLDFEYASTLSQNDKKRIIRAFEQYEITGKTTTQLNKESRRTNPKFTPLCIGLTFKDRAVLYQKINSRVDNMLKNGLLEEAMLVYKNKENYITAAQAIGYKEIFPYFENSATLEECLNKLKQATRNYAKRQLTWFRHMPQIQWVYAEETPFEIAQKYIEFFLNT